MDELGTKFGTETNNGSAGCATYIHERFRRAGTRGRSATTLGLEAEKRQESVLSIKRRSPSLTSRLGPKADYRSYPGL